MNIDRRKPNPDLPLLLGVDDILDRRSVLGVVTMPPIDSGAAASTYVDSAPDGLTVYADRRSLSKVMLGGVTVYADRRSLSLSKTFDGIPVYDDRKSSSAAILDGYTENIELLALTASLVSCNS